MLEILQNRVRNFINLTMMVECYIDLAKKNKYTWSVSLEKSQLLLDDLKRTKISFSYEPLIADPKEELLHLHNRLRSIANLYSPLLTVTQPKPTQAQDRFVQLSDQAFQISEHPILINVVKADVLLNVFVPKAMLLNVGFNIDENLASRLPNEIIDHINFSFKETLNDLI